MSKRQIILTLESENAISEGVIIALATMCVVAVEDWAPGLVSPDLDIRDLKVTREVR